MKFHEISKFLNKRLELNPKQKNELQIIISLINLIANFSEIS